jgi:hypothetical protein
VLADYTWNANADLGHGVGAVLVALAVAYIIATWLRSRADLIRARTEAERASVELAERADSVPADADDDLDDAVLDPGGPKGSTAARGVRGQRRAGRDGDPTTEKGDE